MSATKYNKNMRNKNHGIYVRVLLSLIITMSSSSSSITNAFSLSTTPNSVVSTLTSMNSMSHSKLDFTKKYHPITNTKTTELKMMTPLSSSLLSIRGGSSSLVASMTSTPLKLFNTNLVILGLTTALIRIMEKINTTTTTNNTKANTKTNTKPSSVKSLQIRFLSVFWLLRCADWLQGPYFYEVYSSKIFNNIPASMATVSKLFLTGFASTALFGPFVGRLSDSKGRKKGTLAFALLYSLGAASTKSNLLYVLLIGRVLSGIGTSLLFSAPEAWLVGEAVKDEEGDGGKYLGETFGLVSFIV